MLNKKNVKPAPKAAQRRTKQAESAQRGRNIRETVESIAIAFILAFLFRTFEAEAFVIPTGSMAPTLQGRHKDVDCPQCSFRYQASASSEEADAAGADIVSATCPMCRYAMLINPEVQAEFAPGGNVAEADEAPTYNGDRILVGKFVYEFSEPERWDVIVFKYPGEAKMNYIKRLVGLPNEELTLRGGDVYARPRGSNEPYQIARKPPEKLRAMMQLVHDNEFLPAEYLEKNWPLRWHPWPRDRAPSEGDWNESREVVERDGVEVVEQQFSTDGGAADARWIRYQHFAPSLAAWNAMREGPLSPGYAQPQLINDFYAYNTSLTRQAFRSPRADRRMPKFGLHWVGDLMVETDVQIQSDAGRVLLDLVEGGRHFAATIDVASGEATLGIEGDSTFAPKAQTNVRGPGSYRLALSNMDDELMLWVGGEPVAFDAPTTYISPETLVPTVEDLAPAGVGSEGAALAIEDLRIYRDIYYIADEPSSSREFLTDYAERRDPIIDLSRGDVSGFLSDPQRWGVFADRRGVQYELDADQFFVLGDNSPYSKDSRLWAGDQHNGQRLDYFVDRELLIGKALFIYWPHSWNRVPGTPVPFPFFPNFQDMGLVR